MLSQVLRQEAGFAAYPSVKLYSYKTDSKTKKKKLFFLKELLFGDYLKPKIKNNGFEIIKVKGKEYIKVRGRNADGYILSSEIQPNRILEVNFIDVGQGDGCHIVTPGDSHFIVDAGKSDNMFRFLKWRFDLKYSNNSPPPFTAIITHSDSDHYNGFNKLFVKNKKFKQQFKFNAVYHNGLIEKSGKNIDSLGEVSKDGKYIINLIDTASQYKNYVKNISKPGMYIKTLNKTQAPKKSLRFGFPSIYKQNNLKIEAIGPVSKKISSKDGLPVFKNKGKTKNGNSVILKLSIGKIKILLGGDLNSDAEDYLLSFYSKKNIINIKNKLSSNNLNNSQKKALEIELSAAIEKSRKYLESDIAKSCHHGSADFTCEFLQAVNPTATVISSGDNESFCHPRPVALGTIGKYSRGKRSLIFSTELARSGKEFINIKELPAGTKKIRTITVYGMINVRTDGERVIIAQKLEKRARGRDWDVNKLEWNKTTKQFEYI